MYTQLVETMKGSACARKQATQAVSHDNPGPLGRLLDCDGDLHLSLPAATADRALTFLTGSLLADYPTDPGALRGDEDHWHGLVLTTLAKLDIVLRDIHREVMTAEGTITPAIQAGVNALFDHFELPRPDWRNNSTHRQIMFAFMQNWQLALEHLSPFLRPQQQWFVRLTTQLFSSHALIESVHLAGEAQAMSADFVAALPSGMDMTRPYASERLEALIEATRRSEPSPQPTISKALQAWVITDPSHIKAATQDTHVWTYLTESGRANKLARALGSEDVKQHHIRLRDAWHRAASARPEALLQCRNKSALLINCIILAIARDEVLTMANVDRTASALFSAATVVSAGPLIALRNEWARELSAAGMFPEFGAADSTERQRLQHERALLSFAHDPDGSRVAMITAYQWLDVVCGSNDSYIPDIRTWVPKSRLAEFDAAFAAPVAFAERDVIRALHAAHLCVAKGSGDCPAVYLHDGQDPLMHLEAALSTAGVPTAELPIWRTRLMTAFTPEVVNGATQAMVDTLRAANASGAQIPMVRLCFRPPNAERHRNGARRTSVLTYDPRRKTLDLTVSIRIDYLNVEHPGYSAQMVIPLDTRVTRTYTFDSDKNCFVETSGTLAGADAECFATLSTAPADYAKAITEKGWLKPILGFEAECAALADAPEAFGWRLFQQDLAKALSPATPDTHRREMLAQIGANNAAIYRGLCSAATTADKGQQATLLVNLLFAVAKLACATRSVYPELQRAMELVGSDGAALQDAVSALGTIILTVPAPDERLAQLIEWRAMFSLRRPDLYDAYSQSRIDLSLTGLDELVDGVVDVADDFADEDENEGEATEGSGAARATAAAPISPAARTAAASVARLNRAGTFRAPHRLAVSAATTALAALPSTRSMRPTPRGWAGVLSAGIATSAGGTTGGFPPAKAGATVGGGTVEDAADETKPG